MLTLYNGDAVSEYEAATALTLEARRWGISYGNLVAATDDWQQWEIVSTYCCQKRGKPRRRGRPADKTCGDCALWEPEPDARSGGWCPVPKRGTDWPRYTNRKRSACTHFTNETPLRPGGGSGKDDANAN